jgi:hypothetical protein
MRFFIMLGIIVPSLAVALPSSPTVGADQVDKLKDRQVRETCNLERLARDTANC